MRPSVSRALDRAARRLGYDLVLRTPYSPIPDMDALGPEVWERESPMRGIAFDLPAQMAWAEERLAPWVAEFDAPRHGDWSAPTFFLENAYFESVDAELTHAMIRELRPSRIVELGGGFSSLVLAGAAQRNTADGAPCRVTTYEPFPRENLRAAAAAGRLELHALPAQSVPDEVFAGLERGDVLFVDTTHTVKPGSDVNRIILDALPLIAPGVHVHFHDIWLPWEYHPLLAGGVGRGWAEQYLLQAFLSGNAAWEIELALQALVRGFPERMMTLVPSYTGETYPSGFWIRRAG